MKARFIPIFLLLISLAAAAEPVPFKRAMELALQHALTSTAAADQLRARAAYDEARNMFLPQMVVGSGLAKTWGYPLSIEGAAPAAFQVNYQSFLYNPAQFDFIRSAKQGWMASAATSSDARATTLLEAALTYIQLDSIAGRMQVLHTQQQEADRLVQIVADRVREGVDSEIELTRARLDAARVRMSMADTAGAADVLRERLAQLTGLEAAKIETVTESIPAIPDISQEQGLVDTVVKQSPLVKAAEFQASAEQFRARGEHRAMLPSVDAVASYGYFTRYNNFDLYFNRFQYNNATAGVAIRFPFLNFAQRAKAEQADADALKAKRQTMITRQQVSTETLKIARSVQQLAAADEVAKLEYDLSRAEGEALETRVQAAAPGANGPGQAAPAPGPRDVQASRIQSNQRYAAYLDTNFELQRAKIQLLRAAGRLEAWINGQTTP